MGRVPLIERIQMTVTEEQSPDVTWSSEIINQKYFKDSENSVFCIDILASNADSWMDEKKENWIEITQELAMKLVSPPDPYHIFNEELQEWQTTDELQTKKLTTWRETIGEITPKQLRLVLLANGVSSSDVEAAILNIEDAITREIATIEWQYGTGYSRTNANLQMIATQLLGFSEEQIDEMWKHALTL